MDGQTGELRKRGVRLRVRGRPIDILLLLLERPGDVITRDELRDRLWSADTYVDFDHGLHSAVNRLRDALGDSADHPKYIETFPRRGYRFTGSVERVAPHSSTSATLAASPAAVTVAPAVPFSATDVLPTAARVSAPVEAAPPKSTPPARNPTAAAATHSRSHARYVVAAVVLAAVAAVALVTLWRSRAPSPAPVGKMAIAVLPFENLSGDRDQEYLSDGFTQELIAELGMLGPDRLTVIGRTTSMLYKGVRKSIGEIGKELNVDYLLEGSVRRAGDRMRITAQLVDTRSMGQLWAESYERATDDVLALQSDVARQIALSLAPRLAPGMEPSARTPAASFEAYELFMRGRFFREQATEEGARKAIEYYERALAIDPNYAAAHAAVADAYRLLGAPGWEVEAPSALLPRAKAAAERALALDPRSPDARAVLSMIRFNFDWDLVGAEREIQQALRINPSSAQAHQYYSGILMTMGRMQEAIQSARRAVELDPLAATMTTTLGVRYYYANRPQEAIEHFLKTLEVTPGFSVAHWGLAQCYRLLRRFDEQIEQLRQAVQLSGNSTYMRAHLAYGYAVAGDRTRALALRREIEAEAAQNYVAPYHFALIAAGLGETGEAIRWLERAYEDRSGWLVFLPVEPEFQGMRHEPAFQQLLSRVKPPG